MPEYYDGSDDRDLSPDPDAPCPVCGAPEEEQCYADCDCDSCQSAAERAQSRDAFERGLSNSLDLVNKP